MRIVLVANTGWYLLNFRGNLLRALKDAGHEVVVASPRDEHVIKLEQIADRWHEWKIDRKGVGLRSEWSALKQLEQIYRLERPEIVQHFTIKPILYGTVAARRAGVRRIVNSVTGLGHAFLAERGLVSWIRPVLRSWYCRALCGEDVRPIFQNTDDLEILSAGRPELKQRAMFTPGSGVDLSRFYPAEGKVIRGADQSRVLFVGRLLKEKGVQEFATAAQELRQRGLESEFVLCGDFDEGNPSSLDPVYLRQLEEAGVLTCLGHVASIEDEFRESDLVVLPSYREGMPRVLLEAGACELPVVATDVPGCRDVVVDGVTGRLVPPRDAEALAGAIGDLLDDPAGREQMGTAAGQRIRAEFDDRIVIARTGETYGALFEEHPLTEDEQFLRHFPGGVMTVSLDFELAWGTRGRPSAAQVGPYLDGTRRAVRGLLELFDRYEIPATWASVGALWMGGTGESRHEWLPESEFGDVPVGNAASQPHWYAEDLLEDLRACRVPQEIGCHTLSHLFVDASAAGRAPLQRELERFQQLCDELHLPRARTFIFPKAYMGHLDLLAELGFEAYRGPENKWFEALPGTLPSAAMRLLDARLARPPVVQRPRYVSHRLWMIPSSQFYSPFMSVGRHVRLQDRVHKGYRGLWRAVAQRGVYHLWTHPFNLGHRTEELLDGVEQILREAVRLRDRQELEILSMGSIAKRLNTDWPASIPGLGGSLAIRDSAVSTSVSAGSGDTGVGSEESTSEDLLDGNRGL